MTPYSDIYDIFLSQITDPTFIEVDQDDSLKKRYLLNAIPNFYNSKSDLSDRDDDTESFNIKLNDMEKLILGKLMRIEYLNPQIVSLDNLKQSMTNSKDWNMTSQANHLKELKELKNDLQNEVRVLMRDYSYFPSW